MSDLDLAALLAFGAPQQKAIADSDPYLKAKIAPDLVGKVLLDNAANPNWSIKDKIVAGLLSGLGSGALQGLSTDYQGRAADAYRSVLSGGVTEKPSVLDADIFSAAKNQRDIFNTAKDLELKKEQRVLAAQGEKDRIQTINNVIQAGINSDDPSTRNWAKQAYAQLLSGGLTQERRDATSELAKAEGAVPFSSSSIPLAQVNPELEARAEKEGSYKRAQKKIDEEESDGMGIALRSKMAEAYAITKEFNFVADKIEQSGYSWADLRAARNLSATDRDQLGVIVANLSDRFEKLRTGAASSARENYQKLVAGDPTGDAKLLAKQLRALAQSEARNTLDVMGYNKKMKTGGLPEITKELEDVAKGRGATTPTPATEGSVPARLPGESVADYLARTQSGGR